MATITGLIAAASMLPVTVVTGNEARPVTPARVLWIGGATKPSFMAEGDIWFRVQASGPTLPEFVTTTLNTITQSVPFSQTVVLNGTPPFTFAVTIGTLPAGLSIHSTTGVISGTPTASGTYSFTLQVTNAIGSVTRNFTGNVSSTAVVPTITTTVLDTMTQGTAFAQTLNASGTTPFTWTIAVGTIPSGLVLNSSTGTITGTPTGTGAYSFTIQASNIAGSHSQAYSGTITTTGAIPVITTTSLNPMQAGISFTQTINRTGSTPMTWGILAGTIPTGLSLNSSTGVISGTPTTAGPYSFTVQATNSLGSSSQAYSPTVASSSAADVFSIFGATTWPLSSYTDGVVGGWQTHQYYQFAGDPTLSVGSKIIGARLYVPAGSAHIGQSWKAGVHLNPGSYISAASSFDTAIFNTNGTQKLGSALVEGWNEILFNLEYDVVAPGGSWLIGTMIANGTRYLHDNTYTTNAVKNPQGKNFYLAELGGAAVTRSLYLNGTTTARWYGVDVLMRIPA